MNFKDPSKINRKVSKYPLICVIYYNILMALAAYNININLFLSPQYPWEVDKVHMSFHGIDKDTGVGEGRQALGPEVL